MLYSRIGVSAFLLMAQAGAQSKPAASPAANAVGAPAQIARTRSLGARYTVDFDWSSRPSNDLSTPGSKTVDLQSCPEGVNGAEPEYWVYIAGTGKPEAVKVTGGSCAGNHQPGTLQFNTASPHGAGYVVGSASSGLQEASVAARVQPAPNAAWRSESGKVIVPPGSELEIRARVSIRATHQTIDFTGAVFNCYVDGTCIFLGDPARSTLFNGITLIAAAGRPHIPENIHPMIETNSQTTRLLDVSTRVTLDGGNFGAYVQVDDDQSFLLDGMNTSGARVRCDEVFCGSYVTAPGPFNKWSAVGWLKNMNLSPGCHGNGVDWLSGNTLRISDSVIQGYHQFGVRAGVSRGGYGGTELDNVYMEVGICGKPDGAAGVIAQGSTLIVKSDRGPAGEVPQFQNLGTTYYEYFVVASHATFGDSMPLAMGWAQTDGTTPIEVSWPVIGGITGAGRYKLLRLAWDGKGFKPMPSGKGDWLIAAVDPATCGPSRCKFMDAHSAGKAFETVKTFGGGTVYFPRLDFWPGNVVLSSGSDTQNLSAPAKLFADLAGPDGIVSVARYVDGPVVFASTCATGGSGKQATTYPPKQCMDPGAPTYALKRGLILQSKSPLDGGKFTNYKGRINFLTLGTGPTPLITWEDASPEKTVADALYRVPAGPADADSGMVGSGIQYTRANLEIRNYLGELPDKANWKERLTSKEKDFAVPVAIQQGSTFTLGNGSALSQMKIITAKGIKQRTVPAQACVDVTATVPGTTPSDMISGITPPAPLGNLSLNGYIASSDAVTLHFCNAAATATNIPAGNYSFLAVR